MTRKPTYEDLKQRVEELEKESAKHKRVEEALRESEDGYRQLYDDAPVGYMEYDIEGRITRVNQRELEILGYTAEEMVGQPVWRFVVEKEAQETVMEKLAGNKPPARGLERTYRRKDGTTVPVLIDDTIKRDREGRVTGVRSTVRDITELKQAEENFRRSQETARHLARENAVMADIGRIVSSTLDIDEVYENFAREAKKVISFDRIVISLIDTESGTAKNTYIAGEEVPGRKIEGVYSLKGSGVAEMLRQESTFLIHTEDFSEYGERFPMLLSTFQAGFRSILNVPLFYKGKIIGALLLRCRKPLAYTDEDVRLAERIGSQIAGAIASAQIYAERIQAEKERAAIEEKFQQAQKMESVGRLAGGVAHDFNNMLGIIIGNAELAALRVDPDDPIHKHIEEILKASHRSADTVRQLLAFARKQTISPRVLDLNDTVPGMLKMLRRLIGEDIELRWIPGKDLGKTQMDPTQLNQILANLVVNSRDAIPGVGKITIESANAQVDDDYCREHPEFVPGEYVLLAVSDTGTGMSPEVIGHLFDPFFTTKELGRGTGLGLATVYGIVKQNSGFINVYSEPGRGTTFRIYLPRFESEAVTAEGRPEEGKLPEGTETVLLAEDEVPLLNVARDILERQGYRVLAGRTPVEALATAEKHTGEIHLLLTDVVMPQMNGRELMEKLHEVRPTMKALFMSGYTANVVAHHGVLDEGVHFIEKPFTPKSLAEKVREVLDEG